MRIVSWNVNGIRSAIAKGFCEKVKQFQADIIGVQETKAQCHQVMEACKDITDYHRFSNSAQKLGYSGVALFTKERPNSIVTKLEIDHFDNEGRLILAVYDHFSIANIYFPNGSGKLGDNSRVPYKLAFYDAVFDLLHRHPGPLFVMGDFNTAHQEIDLARPKENQNTSGFLPIERDHFSTVLNRGYVDTFRHFHANPEHYTWWNMRFRARERNIGWRIDGVLANTTALAMVKDAFIWPHVFGSDHCPVGIEIDPQRTLD